MLKALVIKELRESAGIVALAALAGVYVLTALTGTDLAALSLINTRNTPFVSDSILFFLGLVGGGFAAALGLKQTAWESGSNTYHFLLHRPVSREFIFGTKLAVGVGLVMALAALFILMYAFWALTPGNQPTPFQPSMTTQAWIAWLCLPLVYLGAFLSGVRPAKWFGSRLAPLVAGAFLANMISFIPWWWLALLAVAAIAAIGLSSIFDWVHKRDY